MKEVLGTHLSPTSRWASSTPYLLVAIFWPSSLFHTNRTYGKDILYMVFMRLKDKASGEVPSSIWHVFIIGKSMCHHERGNISLNFSKALQQCNLDKWPKQDLRIYVSQTWCTLLLLLLNNVPEFRINIHENLTPSQSFSQKLKSGSRG